MNCDIRNLSDEYALDTLYNTLVYDGELIRVYPSQSYKCKTTGKIYERGKCYHQGYEPLLIFFFYISVYTLIQ